MVGIEGIGGDPSAALREVVSGIAATNQIAVDIFNKLEELKNQIEKEIVKAIQIKVQEDIEKLMKAIQNMNPQQAKAVLAQLANLQVNLEKLQGNVGLEISSEASRTIKEALEQIRGIQNRLEMM